MLCALAYWRLRLAPVQDIDFEEMIELLSEAKRIAEVREWSNVASLIGFIIERALKPEKISNNAYKAVSPPRGRPIENSN
jgi:hypothetical protein